VRAFTLTPLSPCWRSRGMCAPVDSPPLDAIPRAAASCGVVKSESFHTCYYLASRGAKGWSSRLGVPMRHAWA